MALACTSLIHCICELIFLAVITWTCVFCVPSFKVAYLGLSFDLSCIVDNPENYNFTFFLKKPSQSQSTKLDINGNNRFKQDRSILTITKVIFGDGGVYSCEVRNQTNYLVKRIELQHVFVQKAPTVKFNLYPRKSSVLVDEGNRFELKCEYGRVSFAKLRQITWWRVSQIGSNISKVIPREKISVKNEADKQIEFYVIEKISLGDSGGYKCEVMEGSKSRSTNVLALQVIANKKPTFEDIEDVINTSEGKFDFEIIKINGEPSPNITCSIGGKEIISCSGKTIMESTIYRNSCKRDNFEITFDYYLRITEVFYSEHHGNYSCVATNIVGSANTTFTVDVTDVNECSPTLKLHDCHKYANCTNTIGSFTCTCKEGFPGDGKTCKASEEKSNKGKLIGLAIGLTVMVVVIIVLIGLAVRYVRSRHPKTLEIDPSNAEVIPFTNQSGSVPNNDLPEGVHAIRVTRGESIHDEEVCDLSDDYELPEDVMSWEISRESLDILKIVGSGAFGQVAKGVLNQENRSSEVVAIKMVKEGCSESDRLDLLSELEIMKKLTHHPNVICLLGCVTKSEPILVVISFVPFGDLLGYLRKSRGQNDHYYNDPDMMPKTSLTSEELMQFAEDIASGMEFLESNKVIHRDLAARNVLVGQELVCKITDFGMARDVYKDEIYTKTSKCRIPIKWTAYESLMYNIYTSQSDVWSYGILLYELFTIGGVPYPGVKGRDLYRLLKTDYRLEKPAHITQEIYSLMQQCWKTTPSERPSFYSLKETMSNMKKHHEYINLQDYDSSIYENIEDLY